MKIDTSLAIKGLKKLDKAIENVEKKNEEIAMRTVNNYAFDVKEEMFKLINMKFKGKKLGSEFRVHKATKTKNYAIVDVNDRYRWKENALTTLGLGGDRARKSMERSMQKAGLMRASEILIDDANIKSWVYVQLMSVLQLNWKAGYDANQTKQSKKRIDAALKKASKSSSNFFIVTSSNIAISQTFRGVKKNRTGLAPGVYARRSDNANKKEVFRLLKIARKPNYMKRYDIKSVARELWQKRKYDYREDAIRHMKEKLKKSLK